jgi:hypothetical protein
VLGQATGTWTHKTHHGPDSGVSHHLTPYSILCVTPREWHPNVTFSRDSRNGVPKLSRMCPGWTPGTLDSHNSSPRLRIATRCFGPCCRALNIRESRRTPTPDFSKCWASPPHLAKVGVRQVILSMPNPLWVCILNHFICFHF